MSSTLTRRIADLLVGVGLAMIIIGCALAYPFVRDTLQAQSDPSVALSFVVTLAPALPQPAETPAPSTPLTTTALITSTPTPTPRPTAISSPGLPLTTPSSVPAPVVLPDSSVSTSNANAVAATALPAPATTSIPPDRIVIQAIGLDAPVETVGWHIEQGASVWDVPARRAAGWLKTTAPAGQPGNTVLDGHHNVKGQVFRRLVDLKPGDAIDLLAGSAVYHYAVTEKHILLDRDQPIEVRIANAKWIQSTDDERLTLVTCWPYTNNTHRLIIVARPLPPSPPDRQKGNIE
jgi:sortase A